MGNNKNEENYNNKRYKKKFKNKPANIIARYTLINWCAIII